MSGSRDQQIYLRDTRVRFPSVKQYHGPSQEVCGIKWSPTGNYFACGSNDNTMMVFSPKTNLPIIKKRHKAAVKALAWSPNHNGLLATGGGTADCRIRLWNIHKQRLENEIDSGSQVCSLMFSKNQNEIVSTHGFSTNEVALWKSPKLKKIKSLMGHTQRVLYQAMSPDGNYIVSGAGDETLRFWNLNYSNESNEENQGTMFKVFNDGTKMKKPKPFKNTKKGFNMPVLR